MGKILKAFSRLYAYLNWWVEPRLALLPPWITPNRVTFFRTTLMIPVLVLQTLQISWVGLIVYNFSVLLDYVDGALARGRGQMTQFGACADAMADKASLGIILIYDLCYTLVLWLAMDETKTALEWLAMVPFFIATGIFLYLESRLAIIRYEDYTHNIKAKPEASRDLRAGASGKVKMILQAIGVGLLVVSFPTLYDPLGIMGSTALLAAAPFAWGSLRGKLQSRR